MWLTRKHKIKGKSHTCISIFCTGYTFGDKSRFGKEEQRVAHFLEMHFWRETQIKVVKSRFYLRFVETS